MHNVRLLALGAFISVVAAGGTGGAQAPSGTHSPHEQPSAASSTSATGCMMTSAERLRAALVTLHQAHTSEIALGKLAQTQSDSPEVKEFANQMVRDHANADAKLTDLARRLNIDLTSPVSADPLRAAVYDSSQALERTLRSLRGARFDSNYIASQAGTHGLVLSVVDEAQKTTDNQQVKDFLTATRQTIAEHLHHANQFTDRLTLSTAVGGGPDSQSPSPQNSVSPKPRGAPDNPSPKPRTAPPSKEK